MCSFFLCYCRLRRSVIGYWFVDRLILPHIASTLNEFATHLANVVTVEKVPCHGSHSPKGQAIKLSIIEKAGNGLLLKELPRLKLTEASPIMTRHSVLPLGNLSYF
ncbi:hypothetical protein MKX01_002547 [Papaver californicum]|nr:hypothetical protein MKX01_002547 [Papaver californicum]